MLTVPPLITTPSPLTVGDRQPAIWRLTTSFLGGQDEQQLNQGQPVRRRQGGK
jgi:hypothetical protein